jgi:cell wall-associated NlpC family hydrolase
MHIKWLFVIFILLTSCSIQSKFNSSIPVSDKTVNEPEGVKRSDVIRFAKKLIGTPYRYAGSNPASGFDCSGFVNYVFKNFSINLPRSSGEFKDLGAGLKPKDFKVGDVLVFYGFKNKRRIGHVGIICEAAGMKSRFIHSSSGKARGVTISDLDSDIYRRRFCKCINVINAN